MTIELPPEIEAGLLAQAKARGLSLPIFVERVLRWFAIRPPNGLSPAERAAAFLEWAASHPDTPPLSDEAIGRKNLYPGRG